MALKVNKINDLGPLFVNNKHKMVGQDGAYSIPLKDKTLWFFGDTLIGRRPKGSLWYINGKAVGGLDMSGKGTIDKMITNTGLLVEHGLGAKPLQEFSYITDRSGDITSLIPLNEGESHDTVRIWCQHGVAIGSEIYLSFIKVHMFEEAKVLPVEFEIVGSGFAKKNREGWKFSRLENAGNDLWWNAKQPRFASAILKEKEWIYGYGVQQNEKMEQHCYLARVKPEQFEDFESWEYWAGSEENWSQSVDEVESLFLDIPNELSVAWNPHLNAYLAVHSLGLSGAIVGRTAPNPWGPWSAPVTIAQIDPNHKNPMPYPKLIYAGKEHPELAEENGKVIYITYIEFEEYYPRLLKITLD